MNITKYSNMTLTELIELFRNIRIEICHNRRYFTFRSKGRYFAETSNKSIYISENRKSLMIKERAFYMDHVLERS